MSELLAPTRMYDYPLGRRVAAANALFASKSIWRAYAALAPEELCRFDAILTIGGTLVDGADYCSSYSRDIGEKEYLAFRDKQDQPVTTEGEI